MKFAVLSLGLLFLAFSSPAQKIYWGDDVPAGWTGYWEDKYLIIPEKTDYAKTSGFSDVQDFVNLLRWESEYLHIQNMFTTPRGRTGFAVILANPRITSPKEAKESGKPVIYLQGDIHPPEAEGKEALLMVMRDILLGDKLHLLDNQILIFCPDFNPDGTDNLHFNQGTPHLIGSGANSQGMNLNRDAIKLETSEVNGLNNSILNRWDPVLLFDAHAMSRVKHGYAIGYATHTLPTANPVTREYVWNELFPEVRSNIRDNFGLETFTHCMWDEENWPPTEWSHHLGYWFLEAKFVAMAYGLRNRMTVLVETPGHPSFERRIYAQYAYIHEMLEYTNKHGREMLQIFHDADKELVEKIKWMNFTLTRLDGNFVESKMKTFPAGNYHIDMAQPTANLAFYCLEPETPDGFTGWGMLDDYLKGIGALERSVVYPVYKYFEMIEPEN